MADTPLIGWTVHGQGSVIRTEKTGTGIIFAQYTKVGGSVGGIFLYLKVEIWGNIGINIGSISVNICFFNVYTMFHHAIQWRIGRTNALPQQQEL